jgi:hypothetical protein
VVAILVMVELVLAAIIGGNFGRLAGIFILAGCA